LSGLNTPSRFEVNSVGVATIRGSLNLSNLVNTSGATLTVSDITVNTDKFIVAGNTGNITTKGTIVSDGTLTVNSVNQSIFGGSLGVTGAITAGSFVKTGGGALNGVPNILRVDGTETALTQNDVINALGYTPQPPIAISNLPTGNSLILKDISEFFDGDGKEFLLQTPENPPETFIPLGPDNLIVSLGGVIQKPSTDYSIKQENGEYTNIIVFVDAPPAGIPCFILALGGQGSLVSNQDWENEGDILVGTSDNAAKILPSGSNNQVLTVDTEQNGNLKWAIASTTDGTSLDNVKTTADSAVSAASAAQTTANTALAGITPVGGIIMWSGTATPFNSVTNPTGIPVGWALCDGGTYNSRVTPDLRDRFIVGAGSGYGVGATGGSTDATLVAHSHTASTNETGSHRHSYAFAQGSSGAINNNYQSSGIISVDGHNNLTELEQGGGPDGQRLRGFTANTQLNGGHTHTFTTDPEGSSATNANLPPYYALAFIMRVS